MINKIIKHPKLTIFFIFICLYILPLGIRPIIMPDETRYGEIPREMIANNNWVVPKLNGLDYFEKPVLGYWLVALSMKVFGENAFAIRLPFALSLGISAIFLLMLLSRFSQDKETANWGGIIFITCLEVFAVGVFSVLDGTFALFLNGLMISFFFAYKAVEKSREEKLWLVLSGVFCGLAFLTKGFLAFVLPVIIIIPFLFWEKNLKSSLKMIWLPLVSAIVVIMPWALLIQRQAPDFWHFFIWNEHIRRFLSTDAQHKAPLWYFLLVFPAGAIPWIFLLPAAIKGIKSNSKDISLFRYAVLWFAVPFLFFSLCKGKLATYILPCFIPFTIIMAQGLRSYFAIGEKKSFSKGTYGLIGLLAVLLIALVAVQLGWVKGKLYAYNQTALLAGFGLLSFIAMLIFSLKEIENQKKFYKFALAPVIFLVCAHFLVPDETICRKAPGAFLKSNLALINAQTSIVSDDFSIRAVCWFLKRDDIYQLESGGELMYGLQLEKGKKRLLDLADFKQMITQSSGKKQIALFARSSTYDSWKPNLPKPLLEKRNQGNGFVFVLY
ncbi:MAG: phospholipid carrier-dependent glycosyltransferase [Candidatus Omnitrophota bacterium]